MNVGRILAGRWARALRWTSAASALAVLAACGGGGSGGTVATTDTGLRVALTDAPSCGYDHVFITIEKVSVNQSATASETDAGWNDLTLSPARRIDLLDLQNGVLEELGTVPLNPGHYSQIRLVLASNNGTNPNANAVQPTGGAVTPLDTPSAQQSGLKLRANFDVVPGTLADAVLDFDACKSIVKAGNSGKYILKPVVTVLQRVVTAVQGFVTTTLSLSSTTVSVQQNGAIVRATAPDSTGKFSIPYLPSGTYTLVVASEGHATAVVTSVPVGTSTTAINTAANAIAPPVSSMADVTGTVVLSSVSGSTTVSTPLLDATVLALQPLTGGPTIEMASQAVDAVLGTYRFHLPQAAPVKAAYSTTTMTFTPDTAVAGKYTIESQSPGRANIDHAADITAGPATSNFVYGP
jgi:hypothetical protein